MSRSFFAAIAQRHKKSAHRFFRHFELRIFPGALTLQSFSVVALVSSAIFLAACSIPTPISPAPVPATATITQRPQPTATAQPVPSQPTQTALSSSTRGGVGGEFIAPTPTCTSALKLTPEQTEGPFYKANPPARTSLIEPGMGGDKIIVVGYVLTQDCKPIPQALVDFWQADEKGEYDNAGYRMRGKQFADDAGRYYLETILPGLYTGRARHIHVKVQPPNRSVLTTQLYFPGEAGNQRDSIFNSALLVNMLGTNAGKIATYNFVLAR